MSKESSPQGEVEVAPPPTVVRNHFILDAGPHMSAYHSAKEREAATADFASAYGEIDGSWEVPNSPCEEYSCEGF